MSVYNVNTTSTIFTGVLFYLKLHVSATLFGPLQASCEEMFLHCTNILLVYSILHLLTDSLKMAKVWPKHVAINTIKHQ
jgi:hypothetical protein